MEAEVYTGRVPGSWRVCAVSVMAPLLQELARELSVLPHDLLPEPSTRKGRDDRRDDEPREQPTRGWRAMPLEHWVSVLP